MQSLKPGIWSATPSTATSTPKSQGRAFARAQTLGALLKNTVFEPSCPPVLKVTVDGKVETSVRLQVVGGKVEGNGLPQVCAAGKQSTATYLALSAARGPMTKGSLMIEGFDPVPFCVAHNDQGTTFVQSKGKWRCTALSAARWNWRQQAAKPTEGKAADLEAPTDMASSEKHVFVREATEMELKLEPRGEDGDYDMLLAQAQDARSCRSSLEILLQGLRKIGKHVNDGCDKASDLFALLRVTRRSDALTTEACKAIAAQHDWLKMPFRNGHVQCRFWTGVQGSCRRGEACSFAHGPRESDPSFVSWHRSALSWPSTRSCRFWTGEVGSWRFGDACHFYHDGGTASGSEELSAEGPECCICLEAPRKNARSKYGLLEGCDHVVCMACVMSWRQSKQVSREARLGCPVCRVVSYIVVPWHAPAVGDEKLAIFAQHRERCSATPCKWSTRGLPCPAGKECLFDHSNAPQVRRPPRDRFDDDDFGLGRLRSLLEDDDEMVEALIELAGEVSISDFDTDTLHVLRAILETEIERELEDGDRVLFEELALSALAVEEGRGSSVWKAGGKLIFSAFDRNQPSVQALTRMLSNAGRTRSAQFSGLLCSKERLRKSRLLFMYVLRTIEFAKPRGGECTGRRERCWLHSRDLRSDHHGTLDL
eukprot:Skav214486  [mRNA]  locus=scaffold1011:48382:60061:- [translate_table: standard]